MKPRLILPLLIALFCASCAPKLFYRPAATQPDVSDVVRTHGIPALRTSVQGCEVVAELTSKGEKDMNLHLYIRNNSDTTFTFEPGRVEVHGYDANGRRTPYRVFSAEEYIRWKNTRDAVIAGAAIVATVATVAVIANNTGGGSANNNNNYYYDNDFQVAGELINFAFDVSWWMAWTIPAAASEPPAPPAYSPDYMLREHTLYPGDAVQGVVKVRAKTEFKNKILVEVPVNGAYAQFVFDRAERRR